MFDSIRVRWKIWRVSETLGPQRKEAMESLGELGDERSFGVLIKLLGHRNNGLRQWAAIALEKIGDERAVEPLINALGDKDLYVRQQAAEALGEIGDARAVGPLIKALGDENDYVASGAASALGKIGDTRAVEPLIKAMKDGLIRAKKRRDSRLFFSAVEALAKMGKPAIAPLIKALGDEDKDIRYWASSAFERMGAQILPHLHEYALKHPGDQEEVRKVIEKIADKTYRPSGVREVSERPKDVTIERMLRGMASDVRQPKMVRA